MRLAVRGGQPRFTLGLFMFALSLVYFQSLRWSPSTSIEVFLFLLKVSFEGHIQNVPKNSCWFKIWMGFVGPIFISCLCDVLLGVTYANMLVTTQWPLKRAAHLTSLAGVCVVWRSERLMELSSLCLQFENVWIYLGWKPASVVCCCLLPFNKPFTPHRRDIGNILPPACNKNR